MSEKMGLMEFAGYVEKNIRDYLPESLRDAEIQCQAMDKPGYHERAEEPMMALTIRPAGTVMAPVVYLKEYHKVNNHKGLLVQKRRLVMQMVHQKFKSKCANMR